MLLRFLGLLALLTLAGLTGYGLAVATADDRYWRETQRAGA